MSAASPFPASAGSQIGLEIWRIENMLPVAVPVAEYGRFYSGDCYIVLKTNGKPAGGSFTFDLHFLLGAESSQDEQGAAAYRTVELDDQLGGKPVQHREVQGHESPLFCSYFNGGIKYAKGGIASAFNHVDRDAHGPARLFHLKGKRDVRVTEVSCERASLNQGDVFILDLGHSIFQWNGAQANRQEKFKGLEIATKLRNEEHGGKPQITAVESGAEPEAFWSALGGKGPVKSAEEGGSDESVSSSQSSQQLALYRVSDASGQVEMTEVARGQLEKSLLDSNDVFLVDSGTAVFIWIGLHSTAQEKSSGMKFGQEYLKKNGRPAWTPLTRLVESGETPIFKALFKQWEKIEFPAAEKAYVKPETKFLLDALYSKQQKLEEKILSANGQLKTWRIEKLQLVEQDPSQAGQFSSGDSYVLLYVYRNQNGRELHVTYFWQGAQSSQDERAASAYFAVEVDKDAPGSSCQVRIVQGKEPAQFLALFQGKFVVSLGGVASGFANRAEEERASGATRLYHVKGTTRYNTHAVEVAASASSLNSGDCFLCRSEALGQLFIWFGRGANAEERQFASEIAPSLSNGLALQQVEEGAEPAAFWTAVGGQGDYRQLKEIEAAGLEEPRFFQARAVTGDFVVEEIFNFTQDDLQQDSIALVDGRSEVYLWLGKNTKPEDRQNAAKVSADYVQKVHMQNGRSADTPIFTISAGSEPLAFTALFHGWSDEKSMDFEDPYQAKLRAVQQQQGNAAPAQRAVELKATPVKPTTAAASSSPAVNMGAPKAAASPAPTPSAGSLSPDSNKFSYAELSGSSPPSGIDLKFRELYLSPAEFSTVFQMDLAAFQKLAQWKRDELKKKAKLF